MLWRPPRHSSFGLTPEGIFSMPNRRAQLPAKLVFARFAMRGPIFCYCKIVRGKIVHCALHDNATYLVGVCEHIYALLRELKIHDPAQKARIDQVVLPFIERTINFAMKEQKDGFGNQYRVGPPTKKVPPKGE